MFLLKSGHVLTEKKQCFAIKKAMLFTGESIALFK